MDHFGPGVGGGGMIPVSKGKDFSFPNSIQGAEQLLPVYLPPFLFLFSVVFLASIEIVSSLGQGLVLLFFGK